MATTTLSHDSSPPSLNKAEGYGIVIVVLLAAFCSAAGCSALSIMTDGKRVGNAFLTAAKSPSTWIPLAGAAVCAIDDFDKEISDWASRKTPIFGSKDNAADAKDILLYGTAGIELLTTGIAGADRGKGNSMANRLMVGSLGLGASLGITETAKSAIGRRRPEGQDTRSMPSGHSTAAFSLARSAALNIRSMEAPEKAKIAMEAGITLVAAGCAWSRVESKRHYLSDVLVGAAIGNFFSTFAYELFSIDRNKDAPLIIYQMEKGGGSLRITWGF